MTVGTQRNLWMEPQEHDGQTVRGAQGCWEERLEVDRQGNINFSGFVSSRLLFVLSDCKH